MTIVRIGATKKYADNWDSAFGKKKSAKTAAPTATTAKKPVAKKAAKKPAKNKKR